MYLSGHNPTSTHEPHLYRCYPAPSPAPASLPCRRPSTAPAPPVPTHRAARRPPPSTAPPAPPAGGGVALPIHRAARRPAANRPPARLSASLPCELRPGELPQLRPARLLLRTTQARAAFSQAPARAAASRRPPRVSWPCPRQRAPPQKFRPGRAEPFRHPRVSVAPPSSGWPVPTGRSLRQASGTQAASRGTSCPRSWAWQRSDSTCICQGVSLRLLLYCAISAFEAEYRSAHEYI